MLPLHRWRLQIPASSDAGIFLNTDNIDRLNEIFLDQEGDGVFTVFTNESGPANEIGIRVRNVEFGTPAQNVPVNFEIREPNQNRPSGSMLNTRMSQSNQFGIAKVTVIGGPLPSYFEIYISSPQRNQPQRNLVQRPV